MSVNSAIVIAAVGVLGTLVAPIVSQRLSARARRDDFEMQDIRHKEDYQRERRQEILTNKRSCYIAVSASFRRYRIELMNYLHEVRQGTVSSESRAELEAARQAYISSSAEAQMTATLNVLEVAEPVNAGLAKTYRDVRCLAEEKPGRSASTQEVEALLEELWEKWKVMRDAMRHDLGTKD